MVFEVQATYVCMAGSVKELQLHIMMQVKVTEPIQ